MYRTTDTTIYLDHAAATPLRPEVYDAMLPYLTSEYGNPSSIHHLGRCGAEALTRARERIAELLAVSASEIVCTSSGTEANNLALFGTTKHMPILRRHILISAIEHHSILEAARVLEERGYEIEYIPVDSHGLVHVDDVLARLRDTTCLISIMYANNEIGTIEPIAAIGEELQKIPASTRPYFHTDACQAAGSNLTLLPSLLHVDLMTLNGSKMYGPKGTGMLYVRRGTPCTPHIVGGPQEYGLRAGTENVAGSIGFAIALEHAIKDSAQESTRLTKLRDQFIASVKRQIPDVLLNGHTITRLANNIHLSFAHIEGESLILMLDAHGICAATGSACTAHNLTPSHVLRAIGQDDTRIHGSVRFTLGRATTSAQLQITLTALCTSVRRLRNLSPLPLSL